MTVDAHLDLAYIASRGRDLAVSAARQPAVEGETPTVSFPDLAAGGVGLACATIFCEPQSPTHPAGYADAEGARLQALGQLAWYRRQAEAGRVRIVRGTGVPPASSGEKSGRDARSTEEPLPIVLLMEGADALRSPADVAGWHAGGLRMVGLAWKTTAHAHGTGDPGPLTPAGVEMVRELDRFGMIHDASHLAEAAFWQLLEVAEGPICATHSNCRALVGPDPAARQLSDEMIRALIGRGGVIGINFYDRFLLPPDVLATRRATLADMAAHADHVCQLAGDAMHVGLGTDLDGGFGRERVPAEIETAADLPKVGDALAAAGFLDADVAGVMGENWRQFFSACQEPAPSPR